MGECKVYTLGKLSVEQNIQLRGLIDKADTRILLSVFGSSVFTEKSGDLKKVYLGKTRRGAGTGWLFA